MSLFWVFFIPLILVIVGVLITEEGGGIPPIVRQLSQIDSRNLWNAGVIAMGLAIALKYVYRN